MDLLLDREPFADPVAQLFSLIERGELHGCLGATTITTLYYLAAKALGKKTAQKEIQKLMTLFEIAPVNGPVLQSALQSGFNDYEDAVLHEAARFIGAEGIATRDPQGFKKAKIRIFSPGELMNELILRKGTEG